MSFTIVTQPGASYVVCLDCQRVIYTSKGKLTYSRAAEIWAEHEAGVRRLAYSSLYGKVARDIEKKQHTENVEAAPGTWNIVCMYPEGAQIISCEARETADAGARSHRAIHPDIEVRVMFDPEGEL